MTPGDLPRRSASADDRTLDSTGRPPPRWWEPAPPVHRFVAQPGRAAPSYGVGRRFESCRSVFRAGASSTRSPPVGRSTYPRISPRPRGRYRSRSSRCPIARRSATTKQPVLDALVLPSLELADGEQLTAHDHHEGLRLEGDDLSGRDLAGATFSECELIGVTAHTTVLQHARLSETRIERLNAPVLDATRSAWRDVELSGSRIGALDIYDAELRAVRITGSKFDWINLRSSTLEDVLFEDCTIEELDLSGVTATRLAFTSCRIGHLALAHARLQDVDLRGLELGAIGNLEGMAGATLDAQQVTALAPAFASHLGIRIEG